jgi:beta-lactamase regulating signal transducer with metallopeptidase domain
MTADWLAAESAAPGLVLRATLLIGVAWAAAAMLRKAEASAAARHMAWLLGVAALLALPLFWWLAPPLRLPILRTDAAIAAAALPPPIGLSAPATPDWLGWQAALLLVYVLGAALLLLRFALCRRMVARLWRDAEPARDPAWQDLLSRVSRQMRPSRPVELRIARGPAMPMTWGTLAPKVLLPAEARAWPPERRRLVLLHELAHVARRDSLSRSAASLACALYWFHPGAWLAARRLRMEQEHAADDRVLKAGAGARTYALSLIYLASRGEDHAWPDHAAAMAGMCQLERRIMSITAPAHRDRPGPFFLCASAAVAASVTLAVATGVPVRPFSALANPFRIEAVLLATPLVSAPSRPEAQVSPPMQRPRRDAVRPSGVRDGPVLRADGVASEPEVQPAEPVAQVLETVLAQDGLAPAQARQLALYGPQLPRQDVEAQESDPRIPEQFRQGFRGADRAQAGYVPPRSRRSEPRTRFWVGIAPVSSWQ